MRTEYANISLLKKILWTDCIAGTGTGMAGLAGYSWFAGFLGLPADLILIIAAITLAYGLVAFRLAWQHIPSVGLLRLLVMANWIWTIISIGLLVVYVGKTTVFGTLFLVLQVVVVGGLAYLEGRHLPRR